MAQDTQEKKNRILVIDDNQSALHLFSSLLEKLNCEAITTARGEEGVRIATEEFKKDTPFDLIITDIQMPDLDGTNVARKIRAEGFKGPIVVFTAYPTATMKNKSRSVGIDAYFSKTVLNKDLMSAILFQFCS